MTHGYGCTVGSSPGSKALVLGGKIGVFGVGGGMSTVHLESADLPGALIDQATTVTYQFPQIPLLLVRISGLLPSGHQSVRQPGKDQVCRALPAAGPSMLRWVLIQVAQHAVRQTGALQDFSLRLKKRKGQKIAIMAAARKLLTVIWAMLIKGTEYRYLREDLRQKRMRRMHKRA